MEEESTTIITPMEVKKEHGISVAMRNPGNDLLSAGFFLDECIVSRCQDIDCIRYCADASGKQ